MMRRVLRVALLSTLSVMLLLTALLAVWLASNLFDSQPSPRIPELTPAAEQLMGERNDFYALVGLFMVEPGPDLQRAGRDEWHRLQQPGEKQSSASQLRAPAGPPFVCPGQSDCSLYWRAHPQELAAQLAGHDVLASRCLAVAADFEFVEVLPAEMGLTAVTTSHAAAASTCSRWLGARAVVAWSKGDRDAASRELLAADGMNRKLLAGSRSLIGQAVAWRATRRTWQLAYLMSANDPIFAARSTGLLRPLSGTESNRGSWIAAEALFQHTALDEMLAACQRDAPVQEVGAEWNPVAELNGFPRWACRMHVGMLPNQSHADIDQAWLSLSKMARSHAALREALDRRQMGSEILHWSRYWRNTFSRTLLDVGFDAYPEYLAREADVDLHREVLALALEAVVQSVPAAERPRWILERVQSSSLLRDRVVLEGTVIRVRTWQEMAGRSSERDLIRIEL
jgi:hypothetical protein